MKQTFAASAIAVLLTATTAAIVTATPARIMRQTGVASVYYPWDSGGRIAANQEVIDHNAYTAAHRTFPLGSFVEVTNLQNQRRIVVHINDRGPFVDGRVLDLVAGAANALGSNGLTKVQLVTLDPTRCSFNERFGRVLWTDLMRPRPGCQ
jgi:rare lipoprotein A (peptidoglycan hydrolase)